MTLITGSGGSSGKGGGGQGSPEVTRDGMDSRAYATWADIISEGEIEGLKEGARSIYLNNTPYRNTDGTYNFERVRIQTRNGYQAQPWIPLLKRVEDEKGVGQEVSYTAPIVRTVTDPSIDAVRVTITLPQLQRIKDNGDIVGTKVGVQIYRQYSGGSYERVKNDNFTGRTGDTYQKSYVFPLNGAFPVNIRVERDRPDNEDPKISNAFIWTSYTEIIYSKLRYPNSAIVAMRVAANQFNTIPTRSYLVRGIKVRIPSNATPDPTTGALVYNGLWDGTFGAAQWTSDPAWCLWDLLTNARYGFGNSVSASQLDKWSFYQTSVYCSALNTRPTGNTDDYNASTGKHGLPDGLGNYEPRFSCNVNIQSSEEAYKLINDMCSVFRAMAYWSTGALTLSQDAPSTPAYLFSPSNVTEEGFSYSGSSKKTRATVAVVKYFDLKMRDFAYEVVEDFEGITKYGAITKEIQAFACTSRGQAHRLGEWLLYSERYETDVVAFTASLEAGVIVRPGQIISIADPVRSGVRRGGRIHAATTTEITVDDASALTFGSNPRLYVLLPTGAVEDRSVTDITGNVITVATAFSATPNANAAWLFQNDAILPTQWRVLSVQEQDQSQYAINALEYNSSKYDYIERGAALQERDVTDLNEIPQPPTSLYFTEALYTFQNEVRSKLSTQWPAVPSVNMYEVHWRKDDDNWNVNRVNGPVHDILNTTPGVFEVKIYSLNAALRPSTTSRDGSITVLGKTAPPADVTGFSVVLDPDIGATLTWDKNAELDLQGYEIWQGAAWGTGTKIGLFLTTSAKIGLLPVGTVTWWIKALDTSNVYSAVATSASVTISVAPAPAITGIFKGPDVELSWQPVSGSLATQFYEIRYGSIGSTWATATLAGTVKSTVYSTKATWLGVRRWFVAAVDLNGSYGAVGQADTQVIAPLQPLPTEQVIDNNVLLQWGDCTQTLPITAYELRKGEIWETAAVIGTKQGRFTSVFEVVSGLYTYWLAGIDSAGNYGTPGSVSARVAQPPDYILRLDINSTFDGTTSNVVAASGRLVAPVDTTETWQSHFTSRSWSTPQDQIAAGFPYYAMPSASAGYYEELVDYGAVLATTKVTATLTSQIVAGTPTLVPTLSTRLLNTDPWDDRVGETSIYATNFRYVKVRYDFTSAGGDDLLLATGLNIRLDAKLRNDFGSGTASASDVGGTTVNFNYAFIDVEAITVTPAVTTPVIAVYDFVDVPNPTSFKVLLFNTAGSRVSGAFSWSARGV